MVWFGLAAIALVAATRLYWSVLHDPELANKHEWSILQVVEAHYRDSQQPTPSIQFLDGNAVIGFRTPPAGQWVWVLANPQVTPRLKVMPSDVKLQISRKDFEDVRRSETELFLSSKIMEEE